MRFKHTFRTAFAALAAHKSRSMLTILGIVIGIAAIILIASIGKGAQNLILGQIQSLGSNIIIVVPGREPKGPTDPAAAETILSDSLKTRELEALKKRSNVPKLSEIMPLVFGVETASYKGETFRPLVVGASELISEIFDLVPEKGIFFTDEDIKSKARLAVLGSRVKEELFGSEEALGRKIKIRGQNLRVVGVMPPKGQILFFNFDETVLTPYTSAQQYIFGIKHFNRLIVQVETESDIPKTAHDIETTLRALHGITNPDNDDFFVATQEEISETLKTVTDVLTSFLIAVAAISLLVGGIGIMNIMLVSITERTREIGLRKALGATRRNILVQFLFEAIALTASGGAIGILLGALLSFSASLVLTRVMGISWSFAFPTEAALLGLFIAASVGLVFGIYPAFKASRKNPIEALSYE